METSSRYFMIGLVALIACSMGAMYYRYMVQYDFDVLVPAEISDDYLEALRIWEESE